MLEGKVAIVTGAASGLGRATALVMAREGASLMLTDLEGTDLAGTRELVEGLGGTAISATADVTDEHEVRAAVEYAVSELGGLDAAFNSAGTEGIPADVADQDLDEIERTANINVKGVYRCMKHEIQAMLASGGGAIVNASSTWGLNAYPGRSGYILTKHAVCGLTKTAALELAERGVRVNAVAPGPIDTPMLERDWRGDLAQAASGVPMKRIGRPQEVGEAVAWLCSDRASFITGHVLPVDGGMLCQVG